MWFLIVYLLGVVGLLIFLARRKNWGVLPLLATFLWPLVLVVIVVVMSVMALTRRNVYTTALRTDKDGNLLNFPEEV